MQIRDPDAFRNLNPQDITAYLRTTGWKEAETKPGHSSIWLKRVDAEDAEIVVPLNSGFRDLLSRLADVVANLAAFEDRSELAVLADLQESSADVIRIRLTQPDTADGTVGLVDSGVPLIENAPELMLAAACAAVEPRARYATKKPQDATDYVRKLRLAQSEHGSYVLKILSRVPPSLTHQPILFGDTEEPFERRAVQTLGRALRAVRVASDQALASGKFDHFQAAVKQGVSSNLCEALLKMGGSQLKQGNELVISWTWARSRPGEKNDVREVSIPGDRLPVISEAVRLYKETTPQPEFELRGTVSQLTAKNVEGPPIGPVTINGFVEGSPRKVVVTLSEEDHTLAIEAYRKRAFISCTGDLARQGAQFVLKNPRHFIIVDDD
ncbi:hypothetical protein FRUB_08833 [Fimbriiglobus ruber]|uniref:Uncharacterized protein n=1 Tax=Fimbriiglobus ruber TaxID=1908690 RepID=A0A225D3V8_9BACT|nr:hypothetical protein FRUB_08833 [Fimbriiglobus ruber]